MRFRFENNVMDSDLRELTCGGTAVPLQPQVFDLLLYLIAQRARVVSKDDLISQIWGDRIISDSALNSRINAARKALGDNGATQRLIKTIPRKGFRFVGEVEVEDQPSEGTAPADGRAAERVGLLRRERGRSVPFLLAVLGVRVPHDDW